MLVFISCRLECLCIVCIFCPQLLMPACTRRTLAIVLILPYTSTVAMTYQISTIRTGQIQRKRFSTRLSISNMGIILILREVLLIRSNLTMTVKKMTVKNGVVRVPILSRDVSHNKHVVNIFKGVSTSEKSIYYAPFYQWVFVLPRIT